MNSADGRPRKTWWDRIKTTEGFGLSGKDAQHRNKWKMTIKWKTG